MSLNLASGKSITVAEAAQAVSEEAGTDWSLAPYPPERACVEPGDIVLDISRLRAVLEWEPKWDFRAGLQETIAFYRMHGERYFRPSRVKPSLIRKRST
jgi:nucleoside-diphosphate-sugar epimerase